VESHGRPIEMKSDSINDLRGTSLAELATLADEGLLATMLSRIIDGQEDPAAVPATMFNSAIG
jgi:FXSXX-COOH protein